MAYTMKTEGVEEIKKMLDTLGQNAQHSAAKALYNGAGIMADEMEKQAGSIKTAPFHYAVFIQREPSPEEKAVVQGAVGIAKFRKDGNNVQTSVGYGNSGYAEIAGKKKPIPLIANAINSGTSFMRKQPFVRKAVNRASSRASAAIKESIEKDVDTITKQA